MLLSAHGSIGAARLLGHLMLAVGGGVLGATFVHARLRLVERVLHVVLHVVGHVLCTVLHIDGRIARLVSLIDHFCSFREGSVSSPF